MNGMDGIEHKTAFPGRILQSPVVLDCSAILHNFFLPSICYERQISLDRGLAEGPASLSTATSHNP
jgi:hypothetical protein